MTSVKSEHQIHAKSQKIVVLDNWNNYPIYSLESQCPNLTQNGSWNQEIGVPGHGDSIWEIKCKPSNSFPRRQDLVEHEKEVKKFIRNCYL